MTAKYDPQRIESRWIHEWREKEVFRTPPGDISKKKYVLDMFPYPSGSGLHVGHMEGYSGTDVVARYYRMKGYNVLHPMGWDAFGLPAENYAIKTGVHPRESTQENIKNFISQINRAGLSYDWNRELSTAESDYYKWTQWIFTQLFKKGLAYQKDAKANWCPSCQTVLANEQIIKLEELNVCERCESEVVQKKMKQWFFKITEYADELLEDLDKLDWPTSTKLGQKNWIGKSKGVRITFDLIKDDEEKVGEVEVFTTRPDTLNSVTFVVLAPEHPLLSRDDLFGEFLPNISDYAERSLRKTEMERQIGEKKTGVFTGLHAVNPYTRERIPVWVSDFVLMDYGTGSVMGVPAYDNRDNEFALEFGLPIVENALMDFEEILVKIENEEWGSIETQYRLRDWLISRQRYWGAPIPIVYDPNGNPHLVPEEHLPWLLPEDVEFKPTGVSPLASSDEMRMRVEKIFGEGWRPEVDTMDTFVDSSWYYLRYCDVGNLEEFAGKKNLSRWMPVDLYVGGAEHTVLHLLYSRFLVKALRDLGFLEFSEPFLKLRHQGTVLGTDGRDMSKRYGNIINPSDVIDQVGADTLRMYELFMGPFDATKSWNVGGVKGVYRFLERFWDMFHKAMDAGTLVETDSEILSELHRTIKKIGEDIESMKFNTAIAAMMELMNLIENKGVQVNKEDLKIFLLVLAPFAPFLSEELWHTYFSEKGAKNWSVHQQQWPSYDDTLLETKEVEIPIQINGKLRATVVMDVKDANNEDLLVDRAKSIEKVNGYLKGANVIRTVFVSGRMINFVTKD